MRQFTIPQFIDVEDKIIGPITTRQFVIMLAYFIFTAICYRFFDFALFLTIAVVGFALTSILSFVKINGRPFHFFLLNIVQTFKKPKIRVWNNFGNDLSIYQEVKIEPQTKTHVVRPRSISRLSELSLVVDTRGAYRDNGKGNMDVKSQQK